MHWSPRPWFEDGDLHGRPTFGAVGRPEGEECRGDAVRERLGMKLRPMVSMLPLTALIRAPRRGLLDLRAEADPKSGPSQACPGE